MRYVKDVPCMCTVFNYGFDHALLNLTLDNFLCNF